MFSSPCLSSAAISLLFFFFFYISINANTHTTLTRILWASHSTILDICVFEKSSRPNLMTWMSSLKKEKRSSQRSWLQLSAVNCNSPLVLNEVEPREEAVRETKGDEGRRRETKWSNLSDPTAKIFDLKHDNNYNFLTFTNFINCLIHLDA